MKPEEIESARKALANIEAIVRQRDSLRHAVKQMREIQNEMAREHDAEVKARIADVVAVEKENDALRAELAKHKSDYRDWNGVLDELDAARCEIDAAYPLDLVPTGAYSHGMQRILRALKAWRSAPRASAETSLMLKRLDGQPPLYVSGSREAIAYVQEMIAGAPADDAYTKAAVVAMEAWCAFDFSAERFTPHMYAFKALYDARKRGEGTSK